MATEHKKCHAKDPGPFQPKHKREHGRGDGLRPRRANCEHSNPCQLGTYETGNAPPETIDQAMGDDTKGPGEVQQRNAPATEPEDKVAENMDEAMNDDTTTATAPAPHAGAPRPANWDQMNRSQRKH